MAEKGVKTSINSSPSNAFVMQAGSMSLSSRQWDPLVSSDWDTTTYPPGCYMRIKQDLKEFSRNPPPDIFLVPRPNDLALMDFLVIGPKDTPYEGGFFSFVLRCPPDYPLKPPRVRFMTTGCSSVRFNPNLYRSGMVCLSILGTWAGPSWTAALGLSSLLISIQSLLTEHPYRNEPGFENAELCPRMDKYCRLIQHETLRIAVIDAVQRTVEDMKFYPEAIAQAILKRFHTSYDSYVGLAEKLLPFEGQEMEDPFESAPIKFEVKRLKEDLKKLREKVTTENFPFLSAPEERQCQLPENMSVDTFDAGFSRPAEDPKYLVENLDDDDLSELSDDDDDDEEDE